MFTLYMKNNLLILLAFLIVSIYVLQPEILARLNDSILGKFLFIVIIILFAKTNTIIGLFVAILFFIINDNIKYTFVENMSRYVDNVDGNITGYSKNNKNNKNNKHNKKTKRTRKNLFGVYNQPNKSCHNCGNCTDCKHCDNCSICNCTICSKKPTSQNILELKQQLKSKNSNEIKPEPEILDINILNLLIDKVNFQSYPSILDETNIYNM